MPLRDRALAPSNASDPVTVAATETALNVTTDRRGGEVRVTGRLATTDGRPVDGQLVEVSRDGTTVRTVETDQNGSYPATIPLVPNGQNPADRVQVAARFDGAGTSLAPARASEIIVLATESEGWLGTLRDHLPADVPLAAIAGSAVILLLAAVALARRWGRGETSAVADQPSSEAPATADTDVEDQPVSAIDRAETFLERGAAGAAASTRAAHGRRSTRPES